MVHDVRSHLDCETTRPPLRVQLRGDPNRDAGSVPATRVTHDLFFSPEPRNLRFHTVGRRSSHSSHPESLLRSGQSMIFDQALDRFWFLRMATLTGGHHGGIANTLTGRASTAAVAEWDLAGRTVRLMMHPPLTAAKTPPTARTDRCRRIDDSVATGAKDQIIGYSRHLDPTQPAPVASLLHNVKISTAKEGIKVGQRPAQEVTGQQAVKSRRALARYHSIV